MLLAHWLKSLSTRCRPRRARANRRPLDAPARMLWSSIEPLEPRTLLTGTVIPVNTTDDLVNFNDPVTSLREAVIEANRTAGEVEILLPAGIYSLTINEDGEDEGLRGDLDVLNIGGITIVGAGAGQTIIDASGLGDRVFHVLGGASLNVNDVTITGGSTTSSGGGGIFNDGGTLTVTNSTLSGNFAAGGGGAVLSQGLGETSLTITTITNSTLSGNSGGRAGGGLSIAGGSQVVITNSTFSGNVTNGSGGGIDNFNGGKLTITNSAFSGNSAGSSGGGIANFNVNINGGTLTVTNSTFSGNAAGGDGGGIRVSGESQAIVTNSMFSGNSASRGGGGISVSDDSEIVITNSTLSGNLADADGGSIANFGTLTVTNSTLVGNRADADGEFGGAGGGVWTLFGTASLTSTIVGDNFAGTSSSGSDVSGTVSGTFNLIGVNTGLTGLTNGVDNNQVGTAGSPINPRLGPLADNGGLTLTHALLPDSPALNAGDDPQGLTTDQCGGDFDRTFGSQTDIGAFELQALGDDTNDIIVTAPGPGLPGIVSVSTAITNEVLMTFEPYPGFMGGVRVAVADVNGDDTPDIITGVGPGGGPHIKVIDGTDGITELHSFFAFSPLFSGGVFVAAADLNGDEKADIIVSADAGGGPHVRVFSGADGSELFSFFAYNPAFTGGVRIATGDITGDGTPDIITAAGPGGGPHVRVFDGSVPQLSGRLGVDIQTTLGNPLGSFFPYSPFFTGGVFVAAGRVNHDAQVDLISGAGAGGGPHVRVFDGGTGSQLPGPIGSFFAYDPAFNGGVIVAASDITGDGQADITTAPGPGGGPHVRTFNADSQGAAPEVVRNVFVADPNFTGGVFVAGSTVLESGGSPLRLANGFTPSDDTDALNLADVEPVFEAALARLEMARLSSDVIETLSTLTIQIAELGGDRLGEALPGSIVLDISAAGMGWYIDPTPLTDEEFSSGRLNAITLEAAGGIDLLTVLLHELAHHLGADHLDADEHPDHLLAETFPPGERRLLNPEDLDQLFANDDLLANLL